jgi:hypothetical protein
MNGFALTLWPFLAQASARVSARAAALMSALAVLGTASYPALAGQPAPDPVEAIERSADYLEQRARGLGPGAWGGPIRVDLELDPSTYLPVRSIWVDRSAFSTQDDPLAGKVQIALTGHIYGSREEAIAAISQTGLSGPATAVYAYWRDEGGVVLPTTISLTTAPRVTQAACKLLQQEHENAKAASAALFQSYLVLAGVRYPLAVKAPSATGRLIVDRGRTLSLEELDIASKLVAEGRVVRVLAESTKRTADFLVDGVATELKTVSKITSKDLSGALARRILEGAGQGEHIIIDARRQAGLTYELAQAAISRAYGG